MPASEKLHPSHRWEGHIKNYICTQDKDAEIERLRAELADIKADYLRRHNDAVNRAMEIAELKADRATIIEECARVAESFKGIVVITPGDIAAAIRALKLLNFVEIASHEQ